MNDWYLVAIVVFTVLNLFIGLYQKKKSKITADEFVANPNQTGFITLFMSISSTIVGGGMFFAVSQIGYEAGFAGAYLGVSYFFGLTIFGVYAPYFRMKLKEHKCITISDYIQVKYPSTSFFSLANIYRISIAIIYFMFLGAQVLALSYYITYIYALTSTQAIFMSAGVLFVINTTIYTFVGGLRKDLITDIWQMFLIVIGTVILLSSLKNPSTVTTLEQEYFIGTKNGFIFVIGVLLFTGTALLGRPDMWQRVVTAKNDKVVKWSFVSAGVVSLIFYFAFSFIGMYAKATGIENGNYVLFGIVDGLQSQGFSVLVLIAFLGAVISSADTFLNVFSYNFTELVHSRRSPSEKDKLLGYRLSTLLASLIALVIAFMRPDLIDLFASAFGAFLIFLPALFSALFSSRVNNKAGYWSSTIGILTYLMFCIIIPREAFIVGFIVSLVVYFLVLKYYRDDS